MTVGAATVRVAGADVQILSAGDRPIDLLRAGADGHLGLRQRDLGLRVPKRLYADPFRAREARLRGRDAPAYPGGNDPTSRARDPTSCRPSGDRGSAARIAGRGVRGSARGTHATGSNRCRGTPTRRASMTHRLDAALAARGLARSRTHAATLIAEGLVNVDGRTVVKSSRAVADDAGLEVAASDHYVSRAAHKLIAALDTFGIDVAGRIALDVGASTGGFTQVLRERGADPVIALDVGHGQLAAPSRADPRVIGVEGFNVRELTRRVARRGKRRRRPRRRRDRRPVVHLARARAPALGRRRPTTPTSCCWSNRSSRWVAPPSRAAWSPSPALRADAVTGVLWAAWDAGLGTCGVIASPLAGTHGNTSTSPGSGGAGAGLRQNGRARWTDWREGSMNDAARNILVVAHALREETVNAACGSSRRSRHPAPGPVFAAGDLAELDSAPTTSPGSRDPRRRRRRRDLELAIVLGGDGTILRAAELVRGGTAPVLGINMGHVGFLAEIERDDMDDAVRRVDRARVRRGGAPRAVGAGGGCRGA